jgi:hypothetical protein
MTDHKNGKRGHDGRHARRAGLCRCVVAYLRERNGRIEEDLIDQLFNSSEKRLARLLLLLANFGKEGRPEPIVGKISQETLGAMIGTTRARQPAPSSSPSTRLWEKLHAAARRGIHLRIPNLSFVFVLISGIHQISFRRALVSTIRRRHLSKYAAH